MQVQSLITLISREGNVGLQGEQLLSQLYYHLTPILSLRVMVVDNQIVFVKNLMQFTAVEFGMKP